MRTRHRIPSLFNLSMVDVLCCALGCVILLWLVDLRLAKDKTDKAGETERQLKAAAAELTTTQGRLADRSREADDLQAGLDTTRQRLRDAAAKLQASEKDVEVARARLGELEGEKKRAEERLAKQARDLADLDKKLAAAVKQADALERAVKDKDKLRDEDARRITELAAELKTFKDKFAAEEALVKALEKEMAKRTRDLTAAEKDLAAQRDRLGTAEERVLALRKELDDRGRELLAAKGAISSLQNDKKGLQLEADRVRAAADNRFAGINLTGRRVVFLVDMSGSMKSIDEKTDDPTKWVGVRETVAKVLTSLPDLEKFQVLVFSDKAKFLLGRDGQWLDYDAKTSPARVNQALTDTVPQGGTNMYAAFEAAFQFRARGLDTIYLLSDGLPNLPKEQAASARTEFERTEVLSKRVRQTLKYDWNRPIEVSVYLGAAAVGVLGTSPLGGAAALASGRDVKGKPPVRVNTIGFFYESPDVGAFLWALARENEGSFVGMSKP